MTSYDDLNKFIKNYITNDKSRRAIMLTAPWGTGKSFYVKNGLCPYLKNKENKDLDYAIISLYGISDIDDISKNIYIELMIGNDLAKLTKTKAFIIGKTLFKGFTSHYVDLNISKKDMTNIYKKANLTNKLIIIEDLERSKIEVTEVLGFINSLVEQDGAKVLIVANEGEITKSKEYDRIKEKTIGDTINFEADRIETINGIIRSFDNKIFNELLKEKNKIGNSLLIEEINEQMSWYKCTNFRTIVSACQKADDIIRMIPPNTDNNFIKQLFVEIIRYMLSKETKEESVYKTTWRLDSKSSDFSLRLIVDWIENHIYNEEDFHNALTQFLQKGQLKELYEYWLSTEEKLEKAIDYILNDLRKDTDRDIPYSEYDKISYYLINLKNDIEINEEIKEEIDKCKKFIKENIGVAIKEGININFLVPYDFHFISENAKNEYDNFRKEVDQLLKDIRCKSLVFTEDMDIFFDIAVEMYNTYRFPISISDQNIEKIAELLGKWDAKKICHFKEKIKYLFGSYQYDVPSLEKLGKSVKKVLEKDNLEPVSKRQLQCLDALISNTLKHIQAE